MDFLSHFFFFQGWGGDNILKASEHLGNLPKIFPLEFFTTRKKNCFKLQFQPGSNEQPGANEHWQRKLISGAAIKVSKVQLCIWPPPFFVGWLLTLARQWSANKGDFAIKVPKSRSAYCAALIFFAPWKKLPKQQLSLAVYTKIIITKFRQNIHPNHNHDDHHGDHHNPPPPPLPSWVAGLADPTHF